MIKLEKEAAKNGPTEEMCRGCGQAVKGLHNCGGIIPKFKILCGALEDDPDKRQLLKECISRLKAEQKEDRAAIRWMEIQILRGIDISSFPGYERNKEAIERALTQLNPTSKEES
jgi:hypothetical protein